MFAFLENVFYAIAGRCTPEPANEKLYKFVYYINAYGFGSDNAKTLLIVAENPAAAVKELYRMTDNKVRDIVEFTEIKCDLKATEVEDGRDAYS